MLRDTLYSFVLSKVVHAQDAEDITQDIMIEVWKRNVEDDALTYVIAKDTIKRFYRDQYERAGGVEWVDEVVPTPEDEVGEWEECDLLWLKIDNMHEHLQDIFRLRYTDSLTLPAIADYLGIDERTVRRRLDVILEKLCLHMR